MLLISTYPQQSILLFVSLSQQTSPLRPSHVSLISPTSVTRCRCTTNFVTFILVSLWLHIICMHGFSSSEHLFSDALGLIGNWYLPTHSARMQDIFVAGHFGSIFLWFHISLPLSFLFKRKLSLASVSHRRDDLTAQKCFFMKEMTQVLSHKNWTPKH